jgi:hypothetical protein
MPQNNYSQQDVDFFNQFNPLNQGHLAHYQEVQQRYDLVSGFRVEKNDVKYTSGGIGALYETMEWVIPLQNGINGQFVICEPTVDDSEPPFNCVNIPHQITLVVMADNGFTKRAMLEGANNRQFQLRNNQYVPCIRTINGTKILCLRARVSCVKWL